MSRQTDQRKRGDVFVENKKGESCWQYLNINIRSMELKNQCTKWPEYILIPLSYILTLRGYVPDLWENIEH